MNKNNPISVRISEEMKSLIKETIQNKKSLLNLKENNDDNLHIHNFVKTDITYHICDNITTEKRKNQLKKLEKLLIKDSKTKRKDTNKIRTSVRLSVEEVSALKNMYGEYARTISDYIKLAILDVIYTPVSELKDYYSTRYLMGMKNRTMCKWINPTIATFANDNIHKNYIEAFAGTANLSLHQSYDRFESIVLSDNNALGINLCNMIKKYPAELALKLNSFSVDPNTFARFKTIIADFTPDKLHGKDNCIFYAAIYSYVCNLSCYGHGESMKSNVKHSSLSYRIKQLPQISQKFKNMEFKQCDALKRLDSIINKKESDNIIYLDPPYIGTEEIYKKQNEDKKVFFGHRKLCNRMDKLSKLGNIVLLSYRVTASETVRQEAIEKNQENPDKLMRRTIDKLYLGKNYHIAFKLINIEKRQIEILISNKEFTDGDGKHSILYNQPLEYMDIENIVGLVNIEEDMANIA